jgi:hypothetical protein
LRSISTAMSQGSSEQVCIGVTDLSVCRSRRDGEGRLAVSATAPGVALPPASLQSCRAGAPMSCAQTDRPPQFEL